MIYASTLHRRNSAALQDSLLRRSQSSLDRILMIPCMTFSWKSAARLPCWIPLPQRRTCCNFLKDSRANLISDAIYPAGGKYHPRVYGAFPKLLTAYVRDKKIFSIEDAVYKMTAKPAQVLGLPLGTLEKGMPADINVFHLDQLSVHADFPESKPVLYRI